MNVLNSHNTLLTNLIEKRLKFIRKIKFLQENYETEEQYVI